MNNDDFVEVYTTDDLWISIRIKWDPDGMYLISNHSVTNEVVIDHVEIKCKFLEFSSLNSTLIFVDEYGIKHEIDPVIESTREHIKIYKIYGNEYKNIWYEEEKWFDIATVPFDRSFFKIGNCYMVKEKRHEDPWPMMLIGMDCERLHFIRVADPDHFKDPGIIHHYVTKKQYEHMHRPSWFQAMMPSGVWAKDEDE